MAKVRHVIETAISVHMKLHDKLLLENLALKAENERLHRERLMIYLALTNHRDRLKTIGLKG